MKNVSILPFHSILQGIRPTLKYCHTPFYQAPPPPPKKKKKKLNLSDLPFLSNSPQNFGELNSPLKMYRCPKKQHSFFKETKDFISKIKQEHN